LRILVDYILNNARLSSGDTIDFLYENVKTIQRLLVINQYDHKHYYFELKSFHEARLYCEYHHYHNITKTFVYFIRTDINQYLIQSSTFDEINLLMNENIMYGILPEEQSLVSLKEILSFVYKDLSSSIEERSQRDQSLYRFCLQIESTLRQMQGEFKLIVPNINGDETEEEYIENLEYLVYGWETILHEEMNNELNKRVLNSTPLAELEFWHERSIRITSILEQMKKGLVIYYFLRFESICLR
jgi:hypothetical protein